ncbi:MAG: hypothetical protein KF761_13540 [Salinibacterium sp.]|nr:hypothetical protein [Salinibacterium sp.]
MRISRLFATAAAASVLLIGLAGCGASGPVVAPIVVSVGDLQGTTVEVPLNSTLVINTGDLAVDSYTAVIADTSVAEFVQGKVDGGATFNPGLTPRAVGATKVTLSNEAGGIQDVNFTMKVTPAGG